MHREADWWSRLEVAFHDAADLPPDDRDHIHETLAAVVDEEVMNDDDRALLWNQLRDMVAMHRMTYRLWPLSIPPLLMALTVPGLLGQHWVSIVAGKTRITP